MVTWLESVVKLTRCMIQQSFAVIQPAVSGLIWGLSAVRGFRIIDELLTAAGSPERAYAVNGGNDLCLMFLTSELHQVIMEHPEASLRDGPYILKEEYPSFGQPESA